MLDSKIKEQLHGYFSQITKPVELQLTSSEHEKFSELKDLLSQVAELSDAITLTVVETTSRVPEFSIRVANAATGISFRAVPGGHEFSSLILAILNASGLGKLPDAGMLAAIKKLRGPIHLRSYITLSCEVCPNVVQALNQIALIHPEVEHTVIDGDLVHDEVKHLKIQGTPAIYTDKDQLLHSGRINLGGLVQKLQEEFGVSESSAPPPRLNTDVAVVGAGPAGIAAAVYSARKGLRVLVIAEQLGGQVFETKSIENAMLIDHIEGKALVAEFANRLTENSVEVLEHRRVRSVSSTYPPCLELSDGTRIEASSVIVATGARWRTLDIPGEKEYLGRGVAFCPHCDGPHFKGKEVAVIGGGNSGVEAAIDLAGIAKHVSVVEFLDVLGADQVLCDRLASLANVAVITGARSTAIVGDGDKVIALEFADRTTTEKHSLAVDGVFVQIGLLPNSEFLADTLELNGHGEIKIDDHCRTTKRGIYAAGDVTCVPYKQIVVAAGEGAKAALTAFEDRIRANP